MFTHLDMDAFYASVEVRERPELEGLPVVVGGTPEGRGVVAAASYPARRFGIRSAMPMASALKRCPELVILPSRMALFGPVPDIARRIKREIRDELGLAASVGIAPVKFVAKIASDLGKPDGFLVVVPDRETKSVSNETTFATDIADRDALRAASALLDRLPRPGEPLRLIGVGVSAFDDAPAEQADLFAPAAADTKKVDRVADAIQEKFGVGVVKRGGSLRRGSS